MSKGLFQIKDQVALAISEGLIEGVEHFGQFGFNPNLSAGVEANVWPLGGTYVFPDNAGENMELVSDNVADTQLILIQALDANWDRVNIPVALNGTTPVAIPIPLTRINRMIDITNVDNVGTIRVRAAGAGATYAAIQPLENISTQVIFSVPNGYKAKLETSFISINKSGGSDAGVIFRYRRREFGNVFGTGARFGLNKQGTSATVLEVGNVAPLNPKSDAILLALADTNTTDVSARLPFTLYKV